MNPAIVEVRGLAKAYGKKNVLRGFDLAAGAGSVTAILGPNGSGKTTFMRCLLGLHVFREGRITVLGEDVRRGPAYRRHIGYMPQVPGFPENLTVREIAALVSGVRGVKPDFARGGGLGAEAFLDQKWKTLSGGMKQKVNASLAVAFDAPLLVLDEPTASLDPASRLKLVDLLRAEKARGKCILISTHVLGDLWELADRLAFLRDGRVRMRDARSIPGMGTDIGLFERSVAAELETGSAARSASREAADEAMAGRAASEREAAGTGPEAAGRAAAVPIAAVVGHAAPGRESAVRAADRPVAEAGVARAGRAP